MTVHSRHLRLVTPHADDCFLSGGDDGRWPCICRTDHNERFNRASHSDALPEMQILPFAEHVQADPVKVIKSIPSADFIWTAALFLFAGIGIGAFFAMGGTQ